ncbi:MAG: flagellar export chaperone FliS [Clostridia bacterium]|nr:flagellar export chaperone FliS [Clostridia bacterium]
MSKIEAYNPYQKYREQSISTLAPEELLILLYEELTVCIHKSILHITNKRIADAHNSIIKAENIIVYLIDILDMNYPISNDLLQVYEFIYIQLVNANAKKETALLQPIIPLIADLKDTWQAAGKKLRQKTVL